MSQLPIRKLTLYKQGIGYFERQGAIEDSLVSLVVPHDSINDVLKSLTIVVQGEGRVLGIDYETPEDKQKVLSELSIKLTDRASLIDLLGSLRGRRVTLKLANEDMVSGRLIGVETSLEPAAQPATVLLQDEPHQIRVLPITQLSGISLHDEQAATDLGYFLDVNRTEQARTTLTVRLTGGQQQVEVGCLAPGPTWRVSYRLLGDGRNKARLLSWGLFDNQLDEDLNQVALTLVSGRPISFEYSLFESYIPARPQVSDSPTALETASDNPLVLESLSTISHELRTPMSMIKGYTDLLIESGGLSKDQQQWLQTIRQGIDRMNALLGNLLDMARLRERGQSGQDIAATSMVRSGPLGDLKVSSAYFKPVLMGNAEPEYTTYVVDTPVSVRRGQSAMVPIIDREVEYQEICVYNGEKMPNHPLLVWRLTNTTGKALEQGPITIVNNSQYLGEGLMRFTGVGDEIHIPYALEFGILVRETSEQGQHRLLRVAFDSKEQRAVVSRYQVITYGYTLTSHIGRDRTVLIERRDPSWGEYHEMPQPELASAGHTRWSVAVLAGSEASFNIYIRTVSERKESVLDWDIGFVEELRTSGLLTDALYTQLKQVWDKKQQELNATNQVKLVQGEYEQVVSRQEQLRKNLGVLGTSERETTIRNRILDDLETSENRRRQLEQAITDLNLQIEQYRQQRQLVVSEIYGVNQNQNNRSAA